ncbi:hypothetical protein PROVRETT_10152, partial [Providencia rettgeri DSM 1131]
TALLTYLTSNNIKTTLLACKAPSLLIQTILALMIQTYPLKTMRQ